MDAKLCATVTGATTEELRANRDQAAGADGADMVELRVDYADEIDLGGVLADRRCPVVVTCRPVWEGGRFHGSEDERHRLLRRALDLGAEYVDVEWRAGFHDLVAGDDRKRVVLSAHDFDGVPGDLEEQVRAMRSTGADVIKVAVRVSTLSELIPLRDMGRRARQRGEMQIMIGMGAAGTPSRVLPDHFGSSWTYAGQGVAPGQVELSRMLGEFRVRSVDAASELFGVLGSPLAHSLSPAMHNAGFAETGRDAVYVPLEAADVDDFARFADAFGVQGVSVTAPFKEQVVNRVTEVDPLSARVGAVNTLRLDPSGWRGVNTDVPGFLAPLDGRVPLTGCRATILGAGGAARGVAVALRDAGASVTIAARHSARARSVAALVDGETVEMPPQPGTWELLVNTTPIGTYPDVETSPMAGADFGGTLVYDLVYNPRMTRLLADAAAAGCDTIGGLEMLVAQAERQFVWWTGVAPGSQTFRQAAERRLKEMEEMGASSALPQ